MITVTHHACERFAERVEQCSIGAARDRILGSARAIEAAAAFGCAIVKLGGGARLILEGLTVVTVYERHARPRQCRAPRHLRGAD
jgi:hypothetical protein